MTSKSRRAQQARQGPGEFMPPNVLTLGAVPFDNAQRTRLNEWLSEAAWPRGHMEMAELEGFLVALISWPVGISAGAWLPPIWGVRGWKMPKTITSLRQYEEFVRLVVGYMQELDRELSRDPLTFSWSVLWSLRGRSQSEALHQWGRGFMMALTLGSQGLGVRNPTARAAVRVIADGTSSSSASRPTQIEEVVAATLELMKQRTSRGPLGPLPAVGPS